MKAKNEKTAAARKPAAKRVAKKAAPKHINLVKNDPWLEPFEGAIQGRHDHALWKLNELTGGKGKLAEMADGHLYFGLHRTSRQWVLRE